MGYDPWMKPLGLAMLPSGDMNSRDALRILERHADLFAAMGETAAASQRCAATCLGARIAELEAALREIAAGDIDEHGNRRNHVIIARSALHI